LESRNRYRGRSRRRKGVTALVVISAALALALVAGLLVLPNYLVYTPDGRVYFDIPFLNRWRTEPLPTPSGADLPAWAASVPPPDTPTPTPAPTPTPGVERSFHALYAPIALLQTEDGLDTLRAQAAAGGPIDALVLELKAESGLLAFRSSMPFAIQAQVSAETDTAAAHIRALRRDGIYVVAALSLFKDAAVPQQEQSVGIKHVSGVNWLDNTRSRWLDPYKEPARTYLLGLITEVAGLGVDEILLDRFTFPARGSLSAISYGVYEDTPRSDALESFAREAADRLASSHVALSVMLEEKTAQTGEDPLGGQRLTALAAVFDRIYAAAPLTDTGASFAPILAAVSAVTPADRLSVKLVPVLTVPEDLPPETLQISLDAAGGREGLGWLLVNAQGMYTVP
jgi:hypothetical protein